MTTLSDKRFRANPGYGLEPRTAATPRDLYVLMPGYPDDLAYGDLRPNRGVAGPSRPISADVALLFLSLRLPARVPLHFHRAFPGRLEILLRRLVLDGVLEVEHQGTFISGAAAHQLLAGGDMPGRRGPLAALSIEAVQYGAALGGLTVPELTGRLYGFGHRPATALQRRHYETPDADVHEWLAGRVRAPLEQYWSLVSVSAHWIMWRPRSSDAGTRRARFKLYVSPGADELAGICAHTAEILGRCSGVQGLKLGKGLAGINRPDKLVAYFSRLDDLHSAGVRLRDCVDGAAVHGVPFTAEVSPDGLVSWGADRPVTSRAGRSESWRFWISSRLATHLLAAGPTAAPTAPWTAAPGTAAPGTVTDFALDRLRLEGVDPDRWAPTDEFWSSIEAPV